MIRGAPIEVPVEIVATEVTAPIPSRFIQSDPSKYERVPAKVGLEESLVKIILP
jgi:hypothetical protein